MAAHDRCVVAEVESRMNLEALDLAQQIERLEWQIKADTADLARMKARQYALEQGLPDEDELEEMKDYG